MTFDELNIAEPILRAIREKGYDQPTPIQEEGIPVIFKGKDIFGVAQTGTGKTAAFAIPIIQRLWEQNNEKQTTEQANADAVKEKASEEAAAAEAAPSDDSAPSSRKNRRGRSHGKLKQQPVLRALIVTSTRELAMQIDECVADYGKYTGLKHAVIFGGVKKRPQTEKLKRGVDILVATPGRLHDLIGLGVVKLDKITHLVLDEADRMLDMGFIGDIRKLIPLLPKKKQTMLFSATLPGDIVALSNSILYKPEYIEVTPQSSTVDLIDQCVCFVEKNERKGLLISLLQKEKDKSVLIFSRTKHGADNLSRILKKAGIQSEAIHGDKSQGQRQKAMTNFKSGKVKIMVATDITARGIDIKELEIVINYELPDVTETYVHRIGRTGRAGHSGTALSFCSMDEHMKVKDIQRITGSKIQTILYES